MIRAPFPQLLGGRHLNDAQHCAAQHSELCPSCLYSLRLYYLRLYYVRPSRELWLFGIQLLRVFPLSVFALRTAPHFVCFGACLA